MRNANTRRVLGMLLAAVMILTSLLAGSVPLADAAYSDATTKSLEEQIAALQAQQKASRSRLASLRTQEYSANAQKEEIDRWLETTQRKIEITETLLAQLDTQITATQARIAETEAEYARVRAQFLESLVAGYEEGEASYLGLILGADSLSDFLARTERVSSILEYNRNIMTRLDEMTASLKNDEAAYAEAIETQQQTLSDLAEEKAGYEAEMESAMATLRALEANEAAAQKALAAQQAEEAKLDAELQAYIAEQQRKLQAKMEVGDWQWPIDLTVQQYGSSGYGWRILFNQWDFHRGWDIACWLGNDIHAAKGGTVLIATYHYSYGNYVVIDHGDGVSTVYGHASKLLVTAGQKVQKGDVIAKVGTTGNSTGYHLHFEFRKDGKCDDPFKYIPTPPITMPYSNLEKKARK